MPVTRQNACDWRIVISPALGHVTLLHSALGLARIELVVADSKGIGAGQHFGYCKTTPTRPFS